MSSDEKAASSDEFRSPPPSCGSSFSDDSGVSGDVKPPPPQQGAEPRRNKRKSSEPKRLLRWEEDTEDEVFEPDSGLEDTKRKRRGGGKEEPQPRQSVIRAAPRNYKGMSRQRRIEANARERTRVHTIGAAFEALRRAVPAYAHNQRLSKLAVLRIASAYIVALACLSEGAPAVADCVESCTRTIQAEGRSRRRSKD